jgi:hypothetical protein
MRGQLTGNEIRQLVVDDGIFTNGLRITYFTVWCVDWGNDDACTGLLSLRDAVSPTGGTFPANDPSVFAWAFQGRGTAPTTGDEEVFTWDRLDPDHIVNEELFIHNRGSNSLNYLIIAEPYMMTPEQGVMQLVKAANQA